jgi:hypothetical protein
MLLCRHSREGGARSEALALSSYYKRFWMPASAGMTGFGPFYECVNVWIIGIFVIMYYYFKFVATALYRDGLRASYLNFTRQSH